MDKILDYEGLKTYHNKLKEKVVIREPDGSIAVGETFYKEDKIQIGKAATFSNKDELIAYAAAHPDAWYHFEGPIEYTASSGVTAYIKTKKTKNVVIPSGVALSDISYNFVTNGVLEYNSDNGILGFSRQGSPADAQIIIPNTLGMTTKIQGYHNSGDLRTQNSKVDFQIATKADGTPYIFTYSGGDDYMKDYLLRYITVLTAKLIFPMKDDTIATLSDIEASSEGVPKTRKINEKTLENDITLYGTDINVDNAAGAKTVKVALEDKLDKVTEGDAERVYAVDASNAQTMTLVSAEATADAIIKRDSNGNAKVADKMYVEETAYGKDCIQFGEEKRFATLDEFKAYAKENNDAWYHFKGNLKDSSLSDLEAYIKTTRTRNVSVPSGVQYKTVSSMWPEVDLLAYNNDNGVFGYDAISTDKQIFVPTMSGITSGAKGYNGSELAANEIEFDFQVAFKAGNEPYISAYTADAVAYLNELISRAISIQSNKLTLPNKNDTLATLSDIESTVKAIENSTIENLWN